MTTLIGTKENGFYWLIEEDPDIPVYSAFGYVWKLKWRSPNSYAFGVTVTCAVNQTSDNKFKSLVNRQLEGVEIQCTFFDPEDNALQTEEVEEQVVDQYTKQELAEFRANEKLLKLYYEIEEREEIEPESNFYTRTLFYRKIKAEKCKVQVTWDQAVFGILEEQKCALTTKAFLDYLPSIVESDKLSDVELRLQNSSIRAHKVVLSACSPVFRAMFENDMMESRRGCVEISDFREDTIRMLLHFIYTRGKPNLSNAEEALELYRAADKYDIIGLKRVSCDYLSSNIEERTVMDIFLLATLYSDKQLRHAACIYVCAHQDCSIESTKFGVNIK